MTVPVVSGRLAPMLLVCSCSFIPAHSFLLVRSCSFVHPAGYHGTINASLFLLLRSCSFIPFRSFLLVRSCSLVPACWFLLVGSCSLVPTRSFLLGRSCPFILVHSLILLATVVQNRTGHCSLDALQAHEQDTDTQSYHVSRFLY